MIDLNLKSTFFTVQRSLSHLKDGASIILLGSVASQIGAPGFSTYCAAKAAVRSLARTFSAELAPRNIRVNVISPGIIDTPVFESVGVPHNEIPHMQKSFIEKTPLARMGRPEEIGTVATFLASAESSFIVGEEINVDGGLLGIKK